VGDRAQAGTGSAAQQVDKTLRRRPLMVPFIEVILSRRIAERKPDKFSTGAIEQPMIE
jgi:hypothetical protein